MTLRWYYTACSGARRGRTVPMHYSASNAAWASLWLHPQTCGSLHRDGICIWTISLRRNCPVFNPPPPPGAEVVCENTNGPLLWFKSVWQKHLSSYYLMRAQSSSVYSNCIFSINHDGRGVKWGGRMWDWRDQMKSREGRGTSAAF